MNFLNTVNLNTKHMRKDLQRVLGIVLVFVLMCFITKVHSKELVLPKYKFIEVANGLNDKGTIDLRTSSETNLYISANTPPEANDDVAIVNKGANTTINVVDNDIDHESSVVVSTITIYNVVGGTATKNADGTIDFTHDGSGDDGSFEYTIEDTDGEVSERATVSVRLNSNPVANADEGQVNRGESIRLNITANDIDEETWVEPTTMVIMNVVNGSVIRNADGTVTFIHDGSLTSKGSFDYSVKDSNGAISNVAFVTITVNSNPVAIDDAGEVNEGESVTIDVASNDTDAETKVAPATVVVTNVVNGTVANNGDGTITYTHDGSETTTGGFEYTIKDTQGATSNVGVVDITVHPVNDVPVAVNDSETLKEGEPVVVNIAANDIDAEGALDLTSIVITNAVNGAVVDNGDGTVTYTHDGSETTTGGFEYTIKDDQGAESNVAVVVLTVTPENDPPVAVDDNGSMIQGTSVTINVIANDTDSETNVVATTITISNVVHGSVVDNGDGTITYTHDGSETTTGGFEYTIEDTEGATSNVATVTFDVQEPNVLPNAVDDVTSTDESEPVIIRVLDNDTGLEDGGITVSPSSSIQGATVTVNADNTLTLVPDEDFTGTIQFTYTICDKDGDCSTASVEVVVALTNTAPVANSDTNQTAKSKLLEGESLLDNDTDADGDDLTIDVSPVQAPAHGTVTINSDGTYSYTPEAGFEGVDNFTYQICDNGTPQKCAIGQVSIDVVAVDTDNDGIDDDVEGDQDTDGDGQSDDQDTDSDNDGIEDGDEEEGDCDNDGIINRLDPDECFGELILYEGFSPNGDGVNDTYNIPWINQFAKVEMVVFNRWGNTVYRNSSYDNSWDGLSNCGNTVGRKLPVGTYYYVITIPETGQKMNGYIYLTR